MRFEGTWERPEPRGVGTYLRTEPGLGPRGSVSQPRPNRADDGVSCGRRPSLNKNEIHDLLTSGPRRSSPGRRRPRSPRPSPFPCGGRWSGEVGGTGEDGGRKVGEIVCVESEVYEGRGAGEGTVQGFSTDLRSPCLPDTGVPTRGRKEALDTLEADTPGRDRSPTGEGVTSTVQRGRTCGNPTSVPPDSS